VNSTHGPLGAGCVLKILAWLQMATKMLPHTPFVAYGDDDTFWALTRVAESLSLLSALEPTSRRIYAGAMQYHDFWDLNKMTTHGWFWTLRDAAKGFARDFNATNALPPGADATMQSSGAPYQRPYPMAHGLGVLLSRALARELPRALVVSNFLSLYEAWLQSEKGVYEQRKIKASPKCRLGTDSTLGSWVMALRKPVVAVDMLNFNQNWPWPLPNRCHGSEASLELANLHAFHLYGTKATDPAYWLHLHNLTKRHTSAIDVQQPRLRCRHARDSPTARALLSRLMASNKAQKAMTRGSWLDSVADAFPRSEAANEAALWLDLKRLDPPDWLFCGVLCIRQCKDNELGNSGEAQECGKRCQGEWPGLRR